MTLPKLYRLISNKIFPFVALPFLVSLWTRVGGKEFAILALGLPFLFGYIAPGIGTNVLKMWRFHGLFVVGRYYIHHGFIYASMMGLILYISFFPPMQNDWPTFWGNMLRCAGLLGFVGWAHDTTAIRMGEMEVYNKEWKSGAPPEVIVAQYAPLCFSLLGACYAGVVTLGYQVLVLDKSTGSLWWLFLFGLAVLCAAISFPFVSWIKEVVREKNM